MRQTTRTRKSPREKIVKDTKRATDLRPKFPPALHGVPGVIVHLPPTLDHLGLDFSGFDQIGGLVSPSDFTSIIGDLLPIALWGRSSLYYLRQNPVFSAAAARLKN